MLTWNTWVCHAAAAPYVITDFSLTVIFLFEEGRDSFLLLLWFQKFAAKAVAEHWTGTDWWGSEVGEVTGSATEKFFQKLPYSPSFLQI